MVPEGRLLRPTPPEYIVLHHTDVLCSDYARQVDIVEGAHRRKGFPPSQHTGDHIAYHYVVGCDGTIKDTRPNAEPSTHTRCGMGEGGCKGGYEDINELSIAIAVSGNTDKIEPNSRQKESLAWLIDYLQDNYQIPNENVIGHIDASATSCPGKYITNTLLPLINEI